MRKKPTESTVALLKYYSFDLEKYSAEEVVEDLLENYPTKWVVAAVIESIYQGRYRIASINNILLSWHLNGHPQHHFDVEFADLICSNLSRTPAATEDIVDSSRKPQPSLFDVPQQAVSNSPTQGNENSESESANLKIGNKGERPNHGVEKWLKLIKKLA